MTNSYVPLAPDIVMEKIYSFQSLPEGWSFGEGEPAKNDCIKNALKIFHEAVANGYIEMDAFQGLAGEVCVTIYDGDNDLEFITELNGTITISKIRGRKELYYQECVNLDGVLLYIRNYKKEGKTTNSTLSDMREND